MASTVVAQTQPEPTKVVSEQMQPRSVPGGPPPGSPEHLPDGVTREEMWPAPTAEDWKRPCLIKWQRTWEDALAVSRETGKPILVCVNMDGEIASEHYAGIRYRDPEIAKLYEQYVCVIASVYRHNPRDYDEQGNRIPCPRFGTVTCGEHIAIEPILYKDYFEGRRIAPRHIAVETDGTETYDVFQTWDTASVFNTLHEDIARRPESPQPLVRSDRPIVERVASRDITDRIAVESAYRKGDRGLKKSLLEAAIEHPEAAQVDLLREAAFGFDVELSKMARVALAKSNSVPAYKLIAAVLRIPMAADERDGLIHALERIGETSPRARMLGVVQRGLVTASSVIDVDAWTRALDNGGEGETRIDRSILDDRISKQDETFASKDPVALLELAEAYLTFAFDERDREPRYSEYLLKDAHHCALEAEKQGAKGWRVNAAIALSDYYLGNQDAAYSRAEAAVTGMPPGELSWNAVAALDLFARARWKAIAGAVKDLRDWDAWSKAFMGTGKWLSDVNSAYRVLEHHPLCTADHFSSHYDYLNILDASGQAARVLDEGLARFPDSRELHYRLRGRILRDKGVDGLEKVYDRMLAKADAPKDLEWFAGYASNEAAEFHRRRNRSEQALAAYDRAIAHYDRWIASHPDERDSADQYAALALAGEARMALERGDYDTALDKLLASFDRKPDAAATLDGLNISPVDTARMLMQRCKSENREDLAGKLQAALDKLDPELLRLPAYEVVSPERPSGERRSGSRRRRTRDG